MASKCTLSLDITPQQGIQDQIVASQLDNMPLKRPFRHFLQKWSLKRGKSSLLLGISPLGTPTIAQRTLSRVHSPLLRELERPIGQYSLIFQISIMKGFGGKRPLYVSSHEQGKKKGIGIGVGKGPNGGTIWGRKKKRLCFFGKIKIQQIYRPQKKAYIQDMILKKNLSIN